MRQSWYDNEGLSLDSIKDQNMRQSWYEIRACLSHVRLVAVRAVDAHAGRELPRMLTTRGGLVC